MDNVTRQTRNLALGASVRNEPRLNGLIDADFQGALHLVAARGALELGDIALHDEDIQQGFLQQAFGDGIGGVAAGVLGDCPVNPVAQLLDGVEAPGEVDAFLVAKVVVERGSLESALLQDARDADRAVALATKELLGGKGQAVSPARGPFRGLLNIAHI